MPGTIADAWAGLYDMTPDAHPIIGWVGDGVYAACGFSASGPRCGRSSSVDTAIIPEAVTSIFALPESAVRVGAADVVDWLRGTRHPFAELRERPFGERRPRVVPGAGSRDLVDRRLDRLPRQEDRPQPDRQARRR